MSKGTSPWSVVGALLSPSRKRKDKAKKARSETRPAAESQAQEVSKEPDILDAETLKDPVLEIKPSEGGTPGTGESLDDDLYSEAVGPNHVFEKEPEWTDVSPQKDPSPSPDSSTKLPLDDDTLDLMSPSASPELVVQEGHSVHDGIQAENEQRDAEIQALHEGKRELESRLAAVTEALAEADLKNQKLEETNQCQVEKIDSLESINKALEEEREAAMRAEANMREELERSHDRAKGLEDETRCQADELHQSEGRLEDALRELVTIEAKVQILDEDTGRLVEQVELLESTINALDTEKYQAVSKARALQSEMEEVQERIHELEDDRHHQSLQMEGLENERSMALMKLNGDRTRSSSEMETLRRNLKVLETDKADLLAGLDKATQRTHELEERVAHHVNEYRTKETQLQEVQDDYATVTTEIQAALESALRQNEEMQNQLLHQTEERRVLERQLEDLRTLQAEVPRRPNERQLERLERQNRMLLDQIRRQTGGIRHPRHLQPSPPMSREDMDAMALVKKLNLEIFQMAAHMADSLNFTGAKSLPAHRTKAVIERAALTMGRPMVLALGAISNETQSDFNPLPVQFGLQACLVRCCARIISSWYPGHWEYGEFLATIHSRIQESGAFSIH